MGCSDARPQFDAEAAAANLADEALASLASGASFVSLPPIGDGGRADSIRQRFKCGHRSAHRAWHLARTRLLMAGVTSHTSGSGKKATQVFSKKVASSHEERRDVSGSDRSPDCVALVPHSGGPQFSESTAESKPDVNGSGVDAQIVVGMEGDSPERRGKRQGQFDPLQAAAEIAREVKEALASGRGDVALPPISIKSDMYAPARQRTVQDRFGCTRYVAEKIHSAARARLSMAGLYSHRAPGSGKSSMYTSAKPPESKKPAASMKSSSRPQKRKHTPSSQEEALVSGKRQRKQWPQESLVREPPRHHELVPIAANPVNASVAPPGPWNRRFSSFAFAKDARAIAVDAPDSSLQENAEGSNDPQDLVQSSAISNRKSAKQQSASVCWSARLARFLGPARASRPLACAARFAADWLLCGSTEAVARFRPTALELINAPAWGSQQENLLRKISNLAVVMKALGTINFERTREANYGKVEEEAAAAAALLASVRVQRAHHLLLNMSEKADDLFKRIRQPRKRKAVVRGASGLEKLPIAGGA